MAGGFSINKNNLEKFKNFIVKKFLNKTKESEFQKSIYLDSKIAPSAVNLEFYEKIETLSPFGSGNPEPKFVVENLKSINSKIVGDKHIKSITWFWRVNKKTML